MRLLAPLLALLAPTAALAHAHLVSSTPAAGAAVATPAAIELRFSERVLPKLSGAEVTAGAARLPVTVAAGADGKSLRLVPARPLAAGAYHVQWHVVSADTHRVAGKLDFRVR